MRKDSFEFCLKYAPVELIGRYVFIKSYPKQRYGIITHITEKCIIYKYIDNPHHDHFMFSTGRITINNYDKAVIQDFRQLWINY